jgi:hypothetical protein
MKTHINTPHSKMQRFMILQQMVPIITTKLYKVKQQGVKISTGSGRITSFTTATDNDQ